MQEESRTHYKVLKVPPNASMEEIRSSYRNRVFETHPDRVKGREEEFKRITAAFKVLSDEGQREAYDQSLRYSANFQPQEHLYRVADATRLRSYVGTKQAQSPATGGGGGFGVSSDDNRLLYRSILRPPPPETKAELEQRVKARAAPVIKIRSGSFTPWIASGGVLLTLVAIIMSR